MIKVVLVDDHQLVRTGIKMILEGTQDIQIVGEAQSGEEAVTLVKEIRPDVVLMDISMPGMGGLEATRKLLKADPKLKIVVLSVHVEEPFPSRFLKVGAAGYLTKDCAVEEMLAAITTVYRGGRYIGVEVARKMAMRRLPGGEESPFECLSDRELQVMMMVIRGAKVPEISEKLFISTKTVNTYRYRVFEKLGVKNDVELTHLAMRHGFIEEADLSLGRLATDTPG